MAIIEGAEAMVAALPGQWHASYFSVPAIAAASARTGDLFGAWEAAATLEPEFQREAAVRMVEALVESGDLSTAKKIVTRDFSEWHPACLRLVKALAEIGDVAGAEEVTRSVASGDSEEDAHLILAFAEGLAARAGEET